MGGAIKYGYHGHEKPPRMHKKTFEQLKDKSNCYNAKSTIENYKEFVRWFPKDIEYYDYDFVYEAKYMIDDYEKKYPAKNK